MNKYSTIALALSEKEERERTRLKQIALKWAKINRDRAKEDASNAARAP
jgi:hypothetical protein